MATGCFGVQAVYSFWQYELCDVFIELIKPIMAGSDTAAQQATRDTLCTCLDYGLRYAASALQCSDELDPQLQHLFEAHRRQAIELSTVCWRAGSLQDCSAG